MDLPALFDCADEASNKAQRAYLTLIRSEYAALIIASVLSLNLSGTRAYYACFSLVFIGSIGLLLYRALSKPEQRWYRCRALAESVKTSSWRYSMRAQPFQSSKPEESRSEFLTFLKAILNSNKEVGREISNTRTSNKQITADMESVRALKLKDRREYYISNRIVDQREWYSRKAVWNRRKAVLWIGVCVMAYGFALALTLARVVWVDWKLVPIEPLIVGASSALGWMQIKKFNELSSAYSLTALEIGVIEDQIRRAPREEDFSNFVNEAERAFSREHTQWVARQTGE